MCRRPRSSSNRRPSSPVSPKPRPGRRRRSSAPVSGLRARTPASAETPPSGGRRRRRAGTRPTDPARKRRGHPIARGPLPEPELLRRGTSRLRTIRSRRLPARRLLLRRLLVRPLFVGELLAGRSSAVSRRSPSPRTPSGPQPGPHPGPPSHAPRAGPAPAAGFGFAPRFATTAARASATVNPRNRSSQVRRRRLASLPRSVRAPGDLAAPGRARRVTVSAFSETHAAIRGRTTTGSTITMISSRSAKCAASRVRLPGPARARRASRESRDRWPLEARRRRQQVAVPFDESNRGR